MDRDSALALQLGRLSGSHFHTLSHSTVLPPHSLNLIEMVSPQQGVTQVSLGVDQAPSAPPKAGLNLNSVSYQFDEQGSQVGSWGFPGFFVWPELVSLVCWERGSLPLDQHVLAVVPGRGGPPSGLGTLSCWQEGENTASESWPHAPRNIVGWLRQRDRALKLLGSKFIKQACSDSADLHPKTEPWEQRGLSLYTI
jgi:hypothetical protein